MPLRIVLLTNGNRHGLRVHQALKERDVEIEAVVCEVVGARTALRRCVRPGLSSHGRLIVIARWGRRTLRVIRARRTYNRRGVRVVSTGPINTEAMRRDLAGLRPDLLVLGGIGILAPGVIDIPRFGVLNSHPALLPWVRGVSVVPRSISRDVAIGATCHYVDAAVDHGAIIARRLADVRDARNLRELERRADDVAAELMADIVAQATEAGRPPAGLEQDSYHQLSLKMSRKEHKAVERLVREGRAEELHSVWKEAGFGESSDDAP